MKYVTLLTQANNCVENDSKSKNPHQTVENFKSACRSWLIFLQKDESKNLVGAELHTQFDVKLKEYLAELAAAGLSEATIRDRKAAINKLFTIYQASLSFAKNERSSELNIELRRLLQKASWSSKELAKLSGVSASFVQRLLGGSRPQKNGENKIRRLEYAFKKAGFIEKSGHLTDLLRYMPSGAVYSINTITEKGNTLRPEGIAEANNSFQSKTARPLKRISISEFKQYMPTIWAFLVTLRTHKVLHGVWTVNPASRKILSSSSVFYHNGQLSHAPTFDSYISTLSVYFSYQKEQRKLSWSELDTLEVLLDSGTWTSTMLFLKNRRAGVLGNHGRRLVAVSSQVSKEIVRQVGEGMIAEPLNFKESELLAKKITPLVKKEGTVRIRDPWEKLAPFFELEDPVRPLIKVAKALESRAKLPQTFLADAIALRDAFLICFISVLPVRERTLINLVYKEDNTGHLKFSKKDNAWRVDIPSNLVKNQKSLSRVLPTFISPLIDRYLGEARPRLLQSHDANKNINWLFVASRKGSEKSSTFTDEDGVSYQLAMGQLDASTRLSFLTRTSIGISIRTHAFRHLMATRFLKLNPGQFQACADLLGDSIATVMKHYAFHDAKWNEQLLNESIEKAYA